MKKIAKSFGSDIRISNVFKRLKTKFLFPILDLLIKKRVKIGTLEIDIWNSTSLAIITVILLAVGACYATHSLHSFIKKIHKI